MIYFYLKTMASIFFTDSILVGAILVIALLFHSRIKSTVAFLGFFFAFVTSKLMGVDIRELTQDLAGVNYIFWGMAIGSFFIIPNSYSYLLVIGLTPVLFLFYTGIENLIADIGVSSYTLSFSLLSILVLYILKQRSNNRFFIFPFIQYYNPEKTVYKNVNYMQRFGQGILFKFQLPFLDKWTVSQGYDGASLIWVNGARLSILRLPTRKENAASDNAHKRRSFIATTNLYWLLPTAILYDQQYHRRQRHRQHQHRKKLGKQHCHQPSEWSLYTDEPPEERQL